MKFGGVRFIAVIGFAALWLSLAGKAIAGDFRDEFPTQYTETPMGVNLQTGKFRFGMFTFALGPFVTQRGFGQSGFSFYGRIWWRSIPTATGASQPTLTVSIGPGFGAIGTGATSSKMDFYSSNGSSFIWWSSSSVGHRLIREISGYRLTDRSGNSFIFEDTYSSGYITPNGRLKYIEYANGSKLEIDYDSQGRTQFVKSNQGYAVRFEYDQSYIKVCGFNLSATYATPATSCSSSSYFVTLNGTTLSDGSLKITSIVDLVGQTSTVNYNSSGMMQCITLPNSLTCEFTNTYGALPGELPQMYKADQVRIQVDANGNTYHYDYENPELYNGDDPPQYPGGPLLQTAAWFSGPGYGAEARYEAGLLKTLQAPGGGPSSFGYDGVNLKKATYPEGNNIVITRDWVGNALTVVENPKPGSGDPVLTRTQAFPIPNLYGNPSLCNAASDKLCDKPINQVDARGNQTDYTYDPAHGGVLTKTLPPVQVDAAGTTIRPQVRYEYAQRYAWIKNSSGGYVQASTPIWLMVRERTCRKTAASGQTCAGGAADEVITDYDYGPNSGPNNLLLRGVAVTADGQTLRTCYGYDAYGRKISETQPKAGLAVCP